MVFQMEFSYMCRLFAHMNKSLVCCMRCSWVVGCCINLLNVVSSCWKLHQVRCISSFLVGKLCPWSRLISVIKHLVYAFHNFNWPNISCFKLDVLTHWKTIFHQHNPVPNLLVQTFIHVIYQQPLLCTLKQTCPNST